MANTSVGDLFGRMILDASRFEAGIQRGDRALVRLQQSVGGTSTSMSGFNTTTLTVQQRIAAMDQRLQALQQRTEQVRRSTAALGTAGSVAAIGVTLLATAASLAAAAVGALAISMGTRLLRSVISVGSTVEEARISLDGILASAEQGARAFDLLADLAGRVPQTFQEIIGASSTLGAAAGGSADELARLVEIAADIQATFPHLTFEQVASNLQRAMTAGIASAELFRERGISAMLGFQAGATVSAQETRERIVQQWEQGTNSMVGATERMEGTFRSIVSDMRDTWFNFRREVGDAGTFDAVKDGLAGIREAFRDLEASGALGRLAQTASDLLVPAIEAASSAAQQLLHWINENERAIREWGVIAVAEIQIAASALFNLGQAFFHLSEAMFSSGQVVGAILRKDFLDAAAHASDLRSELRAMVGDLEDIGTTAESAFARILRVTGGLDVFHGVMGQLFGGAGAGPVEPRFTPAPTSTKKIKTDPFTSAMDRLAQGRREIDALEAALEGTSIAFDATAERAKLLETVVRSIAGLDLSTEQKAQLDTLVGEWTQYETAVQESEAALRRLQESLKPIPDVQVPSLVLFNREQELAREKFEEESARMESAADSIANSIGDAFSSVITQSRSFVDAFRGVVDAIIAEVIRLTVVKEIAGFIASLFGGNTIPGRPSEVARPPIPRQHGGPLSAFQSAIVGESGPELFVPRTAGVVVPNDTAFGRGSEVHYHTHNSYDIRALDSRGVRQVLEQHSKAVASTVRREERLRGRR